MTAALGDVELLTWIEELHPVGVVDESPMGLLRALGVDIWWVLVEMHALLAGPPVGGDEDRLGDLVVMLGDLQRRRDAAFDGAVASRALDVRGTPLRLL